MDDTVVAARCHAGRRAARDEPVEDRLDLVRGRVPCRAQPVAADRAPLLAQSRFGKTAAVELHHLRAEQVGAEPGVLVGLRSAELVVHVQRRDPVAERVEDVPEAGRVGAARDQTGDLAAGRESSSCSRMKRSTRSRSSSIRRLCLEDEGAIRQLARPSRSSRTAEARASFSGRTKRQTVGDCASSRRHRSASARARSPAGARADRPRPAAAARPLGVHADASALKRITPSSSQSQERPSSICCARSPAEAVRVALERVDPDLLAVRRRTRRHE